VAGTDLVARLDQALPYAGTLAFGDGAGAPVELWPAVRELRALRPDVEVLLGWCLCPLDGVADPGGPVRSLVSGFGLRRPIDAGDVGFVPTRLGTLRSTLRADVLLTSVREQSDGLGFTTEVGWQRIAVARGATVLGVLRTESPTCDTGQSIRDVEVVAESAAPPLQLATAEPTDVHRQIADVVARLVPGGVRLQVGPGALGTAVCAALAEPVAVDTGLLTDAVADLAARGLLVSALAPYATGTERLYDWLSEDVRLRGVEHTHDAGRLGNGLPLFSVNTGIEIDVHGQVNAELADGSAVGGVGGQPDYAAAAAASRDGLSVIALPSISRGRPTLVEQLSGPVTTPSHDVEVVVTEQGVADLRGLSRLERRAALEALWS
jgi:hypothetical protein